MSRKTVALAASLFAVIAIAHAGDIAVANSQATTKATAQWAFAQPIAPLLDPDGRLCTGGQGGPVRVLNYQATPRLPSCATGRREPACLPPSTS